MEHQYFARKVAVVTGGSTGIGRAVAEALAASGAAVVIAGRSAERGELAVREITGRGGVARFIRTDVSCDSEVAHLVGETSKAFGNLHFLFNNAGIGGALKPVDAWSEEDCDALLSTNVKGPYLMMKHAARAMREHGGVIVNTASFVGTIHAVPEAVLYGATRAAVLSMTASAAAHFASSGVRVYGLCPWVTDTPLVQEVTGGQAEIAEQMASLNPSGQIASPEDVASVALMLFAETAGVPPGGALTADHGGASVLLRFPPQ